MTLTSDELNEAFVIASALAERRQAAIKSLFTNSVNMSTDDNEKLIKGLKNALSNMSEVFTRLKDAFVKMAKSLFNKFKEYSHLFDSTLSTNNKPKSYRENVRSFIEKRGKNRRDTAYLTYANTRT